MVGGPSHDVGGVLEDWKPALKIKSPYLGETPAELTKR